jgi:hypothetical protein
MFVIALISVLDPALRTIAASLRQIFSERKNAARDERRSPRRSGPKTNA